MFDYKEDLMKTATDRERVFTLRTFDDERAAFETWRKANPLIKVG
jgi:hypothetical protein